MRRIVWSPVLNFHKQGIAGVGDDPVIWCNDALRRGCVNSTGIFPLHKSALAKRRRNVTEHRFNPAAVKHNRIGPGPVDSASHVANDLIQSVRIRKREPVRTTD